MKTNKLLKYKYGCYSLCCYGIFLELTQDKRGPYFGAQQPVLELVLGVLDRAPTQGGCKGPVPMVPG